MTTASCMGGWCQKRDSCAHHVTTDRRVPVERLCEPGKSDAYVTQIQLARMTDTYYHEPWTQSAKQDGRS